MLSFIKSPRIDRIYYADIFRINTKICVILGHGKSTAARIAANQEGENDLARDSVAIDEVGGVLEAGYDLGGYGAYADPSSTLHAMHPVSKMIYCLSPEQTNEIQARNTLVKCSPSHMAQLAVTYPYPATVAQYVCTPTEMEMYSSASGRAQILEHLFLQTRFSDTYLMPFTSSVEEKAAIYRHEV
ncbi:hypothetical protein HDC36_003666 [Xanthomonas sp. JAI131]|uniref:hypothetical protein n=1 Tax=Xanthomonas sp. JAI131 TaxID=2723067 RepID=UPI0015CDCC8D|nr:hypothetical protein [Xanthomonas sp. JAI131]NYF22190.1 hypothetical protein [Xanthomonas sp. JAI131]